MIPSRFYFCFVPSHIWVSSQPGPLGQICQLATDAAGGERRIAKEVNLQDERTRYTLVCQRLSREIMLSGLMKVVSEAEVPAVLKEGRLPAVILESGYLSILTRLLSEPGVERLGSSHFYPGDIERHRVEFEQWSARQGLQLTPLVQQRLRLLEVARRQGCGVIEIQTAFLPVQNASAVTDTYQANAAPEADKVHTVEIPPFLARESDIQSIGRSGSKQHQLRILLGQMKEGLKNSEPVSFGNQAPNDVITEGLNQVAFVPSDEPVRPAELRITYADGSEARRLPVFALQRRPLSEAPLGRILRVALMSMRHLELDPIIDLCWFRNREVSRTRTLSETDEFCYRTTQEQLQDVLKAGDTTLELYKTGFEPAVIGFFRAVVETLLQQRNTAHGPRLVVRPWYFRGGTDYQAGQWWA